MLVMGSTGTQEYASMLAGQLVCGLLAMSVEVGRCSRSQDRRQSGSSPAPCLLHRQASPAPRANMRPWSTQPLHHTCTVQLLRVVVAAASCAWSAVHVRDST